MKGNEVQKRKKERKLAALLVLQTTKQSTKRLVANVSKNWAYYRIYPAGF